jgi:hypothetical protein
VVKDCLRALAKSFGELSAAEGLALSDTSQMERAMPNSENYVDTFVMLLSTSNVEAYSKFADKMAAIAKKHCAVECSMP